MVTRDSEIITFDHFYKLFLILSFEVTQSNAGLSRFRVILICNSQVRTSWFAEKCGSRLFSENTATRAEECQQMHRHRQLKK